MVYGLEDARAGPEIAEDGAQVVAAGVTTRPPASAERQSRAQYAEHAVAVARRASEPRVARAEAARDHRGLGRQGRPAAVGLDRAPAAAAPKSSSS